MIRGNEVKHNTIRGNASAGITSVNNREGEIGGNTIENNGATQRAGNGIGVSAGLGIDDPHLDLTIQGNEVHRNDHNGIQLGGMHTPADGTRVLNNHVSGSGALDLFDRNENCADNVWRNNTWSESGYDPECTTEGGRGPQVRADATDQDEEIEFLDRRPGPDDDEDEPTQPDEG